MKTVNKKFLIGTALMLSLLFSISVIADADVVKVGEPINYKDNTVKPPVQQSLDQEILRIKEVTGFGVYLFTDNPSIFSYDMQRSTKKIQIVNDASTLRKFATRYCFDTIKKTINRKEALILEDTGKCIKTGTQAKADVEDLLDIIWSMPKRIEMGSEGCKFNCGKKIVVP